MLFKVLALFVMIQCFYLSFSEIFLWETNRVRRIFKLSIDFTTRTKRFALCLGALTGCFAMSFAFGFLYSYSNEYIGTHFLIYAMICSAINSFFLGISFNIKIFIYQGIPAIIGLIIIS